MPKNKIKQTESKHLNMKHKTTWAIVGVLAAFVLLVALNALIVWALTSLAILPIAAAFGYDLPFWPVFILLWFAASFISGGVRKRTLSQKGD